MVPLWVLNVTRHLVFRVPKRGHNFDNHPYSKKGGFYSRNYKHGLGKYPPYRYLRPLGKESFCVTSRLYVDSKRVPYWGYDTYSSFKLPVTSY